MNTLVNQLSLSPPINEGFLSGIGKVILNTRNMVAVWGVGA